MSAFRTIDELEAALREADYLPDRGLSTALFLSLALEKPLLLEGEAGVGKTEAAKSLASALGARLIRLQCYEGLDVAHAVYEWNYPRQLLHIRAAQEGTVSEDELFGPAFLIRRPLLEAIDSDEAVVLLIDEIDRADEEFEAFLLEVLSDFQITIPERINSVQQGLASKLDMQAIYDLVGEKIRQVFDAEVAGIYTYDPGTDLLTERYSFEKGDRTRFAGAGALLWFQEACHPDPRAYGSQPGDREGRRRIQQSDSFRRDAQVGDICADDRRWRSDRNHQSSEPGSRRRLQ